MFFNLLKLFEVIISIIKLIKSVVLESHPWSEMDFRLLVNFCGF